MWLILQIVCCSGFFPISDFTWTSGCQNTKLFYQLKIHIPGYIFFFSLVLSIYIYCNLNFHLIQIATTFQNWFFTRIGIYVICWYWTELPYIDHLNALTTSLNITVNECHSGWCEFPFQISKYKDELLAIEQCDNLVSIYHIYKLAVLHTIWASLYILVVYVDKWQGWPYHMKKTYRYLQS